MLDLHNNRISSLPDGVMDLVQLKILNLTRNALTSLPVKILKPSLIELSVANNKLGGTLFSDDVELPNLQILDVSGNSLKSLCSGILSLPSVHQLNCSVNRLTLLPDMTTWKSMITFTAEDNNIAEIPEGLTKLEKLKTVDLSGNNLVVLDNRVGRMKNLDVFRISGNPLREKKFAGMSTQDLKKIFLSRLDPEEPDAAQEELSDAEYHSVPSTPVRSSSEWVVKPGGILDRSRTSLSSLPPLLVAQIESNNTVRSIELHHNIFKEIPGSLAFFGHSLTTISLAHNELSGDGFLTDDLVLDVLKELNLSSNTINSVGPLIRHLKAPQLEKLDVSVNRLTALPPLRPHFPCLTVILASNNVITELPPESVAGLKVLECNDNDLTSLDVRIGLLGGPGGLERLEVAGNRFRVPKYTILEKGTGAVLAWLRDRIPTVETSVDDID